MSDPILILMFGAIVLVLGICGLGAIVEWLTKID